ncbi:MAG TPA: threonine/serine dehydratase [Nocardioidaceae bacterium]|nr:threonine/serine dehydratase [Nocardioidaceae bacterium]
MTLVQLSDIRAAANAMSRDVIRTPLLAAPWSDRPLWLKAESLQPIGAFKLRGASYAVGLLDPAEHPGGVVTHSSGNHAQAIAYAARAVGCPAAIVMARTVNPAKLAATRALGAEVVLVEPADRESTALVLAAERNAALVPPYDDVAVIAGQGTVGLEVVEDLPDVDLVLVPVSGGGLISGVAAAVKALRPDAAVVGVEPELAGELAEGFRQGRRVEWPVAKTARTIADGLRVSTVGEHNWAHITALVDDVVTVSEDAIRAAMRTLALSSRLVAEPSGAVATAAVLERSADLPAGRTVAVVSGGNVDPVLYAEVLRG